MKDLQKKTYVLFKISRNENFFMLQLKEIWKKNQMRKKEEKVIIRNWVRYLSQWNLCLCVMIFFFCIGRVENFDSWFSLLVRHMIYGFSTKRNYVWRRLRFVNYVTLNYHDCVWIGWGFFMSTLSRTDCANC